MGLKSMHAEKQSEQPQQSVQDNSLIEQQSQRIAELMKEQEQDSYLIEQQSQKIAELERHISQITQQSQKKDSQISEAISQAEEWKARADQEQTRAKDQERKLLEEQLNLKKTLQKKGLQASEAISQAEEWKNQAEKSEIQIQKLLSEKQELVSTVAEQGKRIAEHIKSCNFGKFAAAIEKIDLTSIRADKSYFNDAKVTDHHALIPTINDTTKDKYDSLSVDEKNVFDAIVYRFLAIFYPPYEYGSTTLVTRIDDLYFRSRGISVKALGYKEILQEKDAADAENSIIPLLHTGETAEVKNVECVSKKTSPPPKYTVDSIITLMQKYGIGTSATMAEIVKKLQNPKRQSIVLENGVYSSTSFGRKFISVVPDELKSPELTKNIEEKLSQIGEGSLTKEDFLNDIIQDIRSYIDTVKGEADDLEKEIGICPECNTPVLEKRFEYACATPGCFKLGKVIKEKTISPNMVKDLLLHGQTGWIKGFHGKKGLYTAKIIYRKGKLEFEFPPQRQRG